MKIGKRFVALLMPLLLGGASAMAQASAPANTVATISGSGVDVRWAPLPALDGIQGYNVYRSTSESGPWTKINSAGPVAADDTPHFADATPGDLTTAFYCVAAIGSDGVEGTKSDVAQAANNLVFNPSFEMVDADGKPLGWRFISWGSASEGNVANVGGVDNTYSIAGSRAIYQQAGSAEYASFWETAPRYSPPATPGETYINAMYVRLKDSPGVTTSNVTSLFAYSKTDPDQGATDWYDWDPYATGYYDQENPNYPWGWIASTNITGGSQLALKAADGATYTRISLSWYNGGGASATPGVTRAYYDDVRYQVRRVGSTGVIVGRVLYQDGSPLSGVAISAAGQSTTSDSGFFTLRDVPTGPVTLTATFAGKTITQNLMNVGGCRTEIGFTDLPALTISGKVSLPDGTPAANATVNLLYWEGWNDDGSAKPQMKVTTTADANGLYAFPTPPSGSGDTAISAGLPGYAEGATQRTLGKFGPAVVDLTTGDKAPSIYAVKTIAAPTIDGIVNAAEWAGAQSIPVDFGSNGSIHTTARILWDSANLYISFVGDEPNPAGILAAADSHDNGKIWYADPSWNADDCYGVWLDAARMGCAGFGNEQLQILTNANLTSPSEADIAWRDYLPGGDYGWDLDWNLTGIEWVANVDFVAKTYTTEMKVPFAGMADNGFGGTPAKVGDYWRVRLTRHRNQPVTNDPGAGDGGMDMAATDTSWNTLHFVTALPVRGDVNADGAVNALDAALALKIAAGIEAAGSRAGLGDVDSDNSVSLRDALSILRGVAGPQG